MEERNEVHREDLTIIGNRKNSGRKEDAIAKVGKAM